ncbi:MAG: hypothetical protein K0S05_1060 [Agromyces sp.]|nr:hypothetical protein [Agromyces sp.]
MTSEPGLASILSASRGERSRRRATEPPASRIPAASCASTCGPCSCRRHGRTRRPCRRRGHDHDRLHPRDAGRRSRRRAPHRDAGSHRGRRGERRLRHRRRRDAGSRHRRDGRRGRRDEGHRDAANRVAAPADAGCCRAWDAAPCPASWRTGCSRGAAGRGANPCPASSRTGCSRGAARRGAAPDAGWPRPAWVPTTASRRRMPRAPQALRRASRPIPEQQPRPAPPPRPARPSPRPGPGARRPSAVPRQAARRERPRASVPAWVRASRRTPLPVPTSRVPPWRKHRRHRSNRPRFRPRPPRARPSGVARRGVRCWTRVP